MSLRRAIVIASLAVGSTSSAVALENITRGEIALLPPYCPDARTFSASGFPEGPTPAQSRWIAQMGPTFWTIHHYCWALIGANRAKQAGITPEFRRSLYRSAVGDCLFVIEHGRADFILLPEIYLRMGQFSIGAQEPARALEYFEKSRQIKPDYWPAYLELADLQASLGRRQQALEALQAGLTLIPGQPALAEALRKLSAKPSSATQAARRTPAAKP